MLKVHAVISHSPTTRYQWWWGYVVKGFDPTDHCQKCFIGRRITQINMRMEPQKRIPIYVNEGDLLYFCAGDIDWIWKNNFHLAGRVARGAFAAMEIQPEGTFAVENLEQIQIDAAPAQELFQGLGKKFLTCRNFQFGAQMFGKGTPRVDPGRRSRRKDELDFGEEDWPPVPAHELTRKAGVPHGQKYFF